MSQSERERALTLDLLNAAAKIRHWHDWGRDNEGMVVSHDSVFELWEARDKLKAALAAPEPPELARPRTLEELRREIGDIESELAVHVEHELNQREGRNADRETIAKLTTALAAAPRPALSLDALREAAKSLMNEVLGMLGFAELELREVLGNSNVSCLQRRAEEVKAALDPPAPREGA